MFFFRSPLLGHVLLDVLLVMHATQKKTPCSLSLSLSGLRSTCSKDSTSALSIIPSEFFSCHHNPHPLPYTHCLTHTTLHTRPILPMLNNIPCPSTNVVQAQLTHMPSFSYDRRVVECYDNVDFCSKMRIKIISAQGQKESFIHNQTRAYLNAETTFSGSVPCTMAIDNTQKKG